MKNRATAKAFNDEWNAYIIIIIIILLNNSRWFSL